MKIAQGETLGKQCNEDVPPQRGDMKIAQDRGPHGQVFVRGVEGETLGILSTRFLKINPRGVNRVKIRVDEPFL